MRSKPRGLAPARGEIQSTARASQSLGRRGGARCRGCVPWVTKQSGQGRGLPQLCVNYLDVIVAGNHAASMLPLQPYQPYLPRYLHALCRQGYGCRAASWQQHWLPPDSEKAVHIPAIRMHAAENSTMRTSHHVNFKMMSCVLAPTPRLLLGRAGWGVSLHCCSDASPFPTTPISACPGHTTHLEFGTVG